MTHYWWMHWFWITSWISLTVCKSFSASNATALPPVNVSDYFRHLTKTLEGLKPVTSVAPPTVAKTTPALKIFPYVKYNKTTQKKIGLLFGNATVKNKAKDDRDMEKEKLKEAVINISENVTDNQVLVNDSFITINRTDNFNLTYFETDASLNQSSIKNSERMGVEEIQDIGISESNLSAAGITGITLGCVVIVGLLSGVSYFIYRSRGFNRPQVLNDRCSNPDSSGYIDDASVRDNSEEMYSLDNDSFLNSLEAMTIQNYWTDTVKHTKL